MDKQERLEHQKEMESKLWSGDITNLTNKQIEELVTRFFYNTLLIDINTFNIGYKSDETGTYVKLVVEGVAYGDSDNLTESEIAEIEKQLDEDEDEEEGD
jgi:hypothetical protein